MSPLKHPKYNIAIDNHHLVLGNFDDSRKEGHLGAREIAHYMVNIPPQHSPRRWGNPGERHAVAQTESWESAG